MRQASLPPAFQLVILPGTENPREIACADILPHGEMVDGLVLWRESGLRLDCVFAVHLETGETSAAAIDLMVAALADTVSAALPATVRLHCESPATVMIDGRPLCGIDVIGDDTGEGGAIGLALDVPVASQTLGIGLRDAGVADVDPVDLLEALAQRLIYWAARVDAEGPDVLWASLDRHRTARLH